MSRPFSRRLAWLAVASVTAAAGVSTVMANHSWGGYHWARTSNPFTLKLGDNVNSTWDPYLVQASSDWSKSTVLDTTIVAGGTNPRNCKATSGRVEVCNSTYGNNGWLGVASISITGGTHITKGSVKMNDTYFNTATYNTPAWRQMVVCQEVGHTFGLDHQDENFSNPNLGTCMDYTSDPSTNQHPNQHDYDELQTIYAHLDSSTTIGMSASSSFYAVDIDHTAPRTWGRLVRQSNGGRTEVYELELGAGAKTVTFVVWALEAGGGPGRR
jgi:hypothetical protein